MKYGNWFGKYWKKKRQVCAGLMSLCLLAGSVEFALPQRVFAEEDGPIILDNTGGYKNNEDTHQPETGETEKKSESETGTGSGEPETGETGVSPVITIEGIEVTDQVPAGVSGSQDHIVLDWTWVGDEEDWNVQYDETTDTWGIGLAGASEGDPVDFDTIVSLLPEAIEATILDAEQPEELQITWKCDEYVPDENGCWPLTGTYTFSGELPEGYALAETTDSFCVNVELGGEIGLFATSNLDVSSGNVNITAGGEYTITGTTSTNKIVVNTDSDVIITLNNVNIDVSSTSQACALEIQGTGNVTIKLQGRNILKSGPGTAGLQKNQTSNNLTITSADGDKAVTGYLEAIGQADGAGIGGCKPTTAVDCNNITINGGTIKATGGTYSPGIGGFDSTKNITINGGEIEATGGWYAAGIGSGSYGSVENIVITGGTIKATGKTGGAGIGGCSNGYNVDNIIISGGTVTAFGSDGSPGIGKGAGSGSNSGFSTGTNGNAIIVTNAIGDTSGRDKWSGIINEDNGDSFTVYGSPVLTQDFEILDGKKLLILQNSTLTIANGSTLTNSGALQNNGKIIAEGTFINSGTILK